MFDRLIAALAFACTATCFATSLAAAEEKPTAAKTAEKVSATDAAPSWAETGWPMIQRFCIDCHNEDFQEAEIDLSQFATLQGIQENQETFEKALGMVRFGAMPPEDYDVPSDEERKQFTETIEAALYSVTCDLGPRAGKVTARRLNRAEYNNAIRDLFGLDLKPADDFPSDEVGGGFDNNGDVLSLSPMLFEKYIAAAEEVSTQVLFDPDTMPRIDTDRPSDQLVVHGKTKTGSFNGRFLDADAYAWTEIEAPLDGEYELAVRAGSTADEDEKEKDDEKDKDGQDSRHVFAVYNEEGVLVARFEFGYYGGGGGSDHESTSLELSKGLHRFIIEPTEDDRSLEIGKTKFEHIDELTEDVLKQGRESFGKALSPDRDIDAEAFPAMVRHVSLKGPKKPTDDLLPPAQHEILKRHPKRRDGRWVDVKEAAIECLQPIMRRAFRVPVAQAEVEPYAELVEAAVKRGESYHRGLQIGISAILVSPRFLFRVETPPEDWKGEAGDEVQLTQHQLATRLSFFLWSSLPDEELMQLAEQGKLHGKELDQQVKRMLSDPRSEALGAQFAAQWLGLRNLDGAQPDAERFQGFSPSLLPLMAEETEALFLHIARNNLPIPELLTADYSFLNEELAEYYGIEGIDGDQMRKVSLVGTPRRGVLSHASVLTLTSYPTRTSPVRRGKWILENVLGTPPPDPPPGVPELEDTKTASANASLREQLELHRADPGCASCHRVMDQLGFGLEQFNAVGRFRLSDTERETEIDASGVLPGGRSFAGAAELSEVLGKSERRAFAKTAVDRLMTFALGRELSPVDRCTVDDIVKRTAEDDFRFIDIVIEIVHSRPFQYYEWRRDS